MDYDLFTEKCLPLNNRFELHFLLSMQEENILYKPCTIKQQLHKLVNIEIVIIRHCE